MTTRAEQLALRLNVNGIDWKNEKYIAVLTILDAALRAVERETWEQAAKLADTYECGGPKWNCGAIATLCRQRAEQAGRGEVT